MSFAAIGCGDTSPLAGIDAGPTPDIDIEDANNNDLDNGSYLLINQGAKRISLGYNESAPISIKLTTVSGAVVANAKILLELSMDVDRTASLSNAGAKYSTVVKTDNKGIASANVYSANQDATGFLTATLHGTAGTLLECNSLSIKIVVKKDDGETTTDGGTLDDDDIDPTGKTGSITVSVVNNSGARKAEINVLPIESSDSTDYCSKILTGTGLNTFTTSKTISVASGSGGAIFRNIDANKRAVVFAYGLDENENEIGNADCTTTNVIAAGKTESVQLSLERVPEALPDLDQSYDTLLHLDLTTIMPPSWQKWFNLVDDIFTSPIGTAIYYALYAWEFRGNYAQTGGGSTIDLKIMSVNVWNAVIRGNLDHNPTASELMINCDLMEGTKTGSCPEFTLSALVFSVGPYEVFPLAVNAAEDYLNGLGNFGEIYDDIKTVGSNITTMARRFDIGARFDVQKTSDTEVNITETWTHVVWTWQLNDESDACTSSHSSAEYKKCGRHAFPLVKNGNMASSFVHEVYPANLTVPASGTVTMKLPTEHDFLLKYGALLRILINNVVVPQVISHGDGYDADGDPVQLTADSDLGTLLNYLIPCYKIAEGLHDWLEEKTSEWEVSGINIGQIIMGFLDTGKLDGYCESGLNAGSSYALAQLDKLIADANVKVRSGSSFEVTSVQNNVPQVLKNLHYKVGVTVNGSQVNEDGDVISGSSTNYDATITGEGILAVDTPPGVVQCADFLVLTDEAAMEACGF